ncbi:MAG: hypothetical protein SP4CHLAM5_10330 [Chlamydiia bacterium]|nr:hypothetical protein [Chlamydiia bacterium]MCH9618890.1 hypothetical protein [Chlamydiia bacterium]MCH9624557.1 hypothetical protein [Chlamydiia bacterium]
MELTNRNQVSNNYANKTLVTPLSKSAKKRALIKKSAKILTIACVALAVIGFLALAPLSLGIVPITLGAAALISLSTIGTSLGGALLVNLWKNKLLHGNKALALIPQSELDKMDVQQLSKLRHQIRNRQMNLEEKDTQESKTLNDLSTKIDAVIDSKYQTLANLRNNT